MRGRRKHYSHYLYLIIGVMVVSIVISTIFKIAGAGTESYTYFDSENENKSQTNAFFRSDLPIISSDFKSKNIWKSNNKRKTKPVRSINIISSNKSNPVSYYIKLIENYTKKDMNKFEIEFHSDIIKIIYNSTYLKLHSTNKPNLFYASFIMPVNGVYNISFKKGKKIIFSSLHNITNLDVVPENYTRLECFGDYEYRWCRAKNICWSNKRFIFFGYGNAKTNHSLMYPGSRPIPHDYTSCRVVVRFRTTDSTYPINDSVEIVHNRSFITCRWFGMQHLWHALYDYTLPLYWTERLNGGVNRSDRIFTIDENTSKKGYQFLDAFTSNEIVNVRINGGRKTCWDNAIIGFPKSEFHINQSRWTTMLDNPYEFPREAFIGFREHMISFYSGKEVMEKQCTPNKTNPRVVIAFRTSPKRHIVNKVEIVKAMSEWCPNCIIDQTYFANETFSQQLSYVCNASILISIHGSGLSHMAWMKACDNVSNTAVIEILPYKYTCRDWYEQIANGAGIKYYKWLNTIRNNTVCGRDDENLRYYEDCINGKIECLSDQCHDVLRDQLTTVDLDDFKKTFIDAVNFVSK